MVVLNQDLKSGELITPDKLEVVEKAEKTQPGKPVKEDADLTNVKMAYSARKGQVLTEPMCFRFKYVRLAVNSVGQIGKGSAIAKGKNDEAIFEQNMDGTFTLITGRIGVRVGPDKPRKKILSMAEWDEQMDSFKRRGYQAVTTEKHEKKKLQKSGKYKKTGDDSVDDILGILTTAANMAVQENITVTVEDISKQQLTQAQEIISYLNSKKETLSPAAFNAKLHDLYVTIPRNIVNPKKMEVHRQKEFDQKIADEQEFLDFLVNQVRMAKEFIAISPTITLPEKYGMEWRSVTDDEIALIKEKMANNANQFVRAWRVVNQKTEKNFDLYCEKKKLSEDHGISHLFHGSGTENFFSIASNGLYLNPTGVLISGKAFGHGIYFAPKAQKSIGYTSSAGSYWRKGDQKVAYLAIFKVASGEVYDIYGEGLGVPDNYQQLQQKHPGADCTWAYGRQTYQNSYLANDEVIVYREDQCTIEYLIEFTKN